MRQEPFAVFRERTGEIVAGEGLHTSDYIRESRLRQLRLVHGTDYKCPRRLGWDGLAEKQIICELFDKDTRMFRGSSWWNGAIDRVFGGHPDGTIAMTRSAENVRLKNNRIVNGNDKMVLDHADMK